MEDKKKTRSEKMYSNSPKLEKDSDGKTVLSKGEKKAAAVNAGTDNAAHGADLPEHTQKMVDLMEKHAGERLDMHNKHLKEHMDTMHQMAKMAIPTDQKEESGEE